MAGETEEEILEEDDEADEVEEEDKSDDEVIPVRGQRNAAFARQRIASKEARKVIGKEKEQESDDEELTEKASKLIEKEVDRRVGTIAGELEVKLDVNTYVAEHPEDKSFAKKATKYMLAHPTLTVEDAFSLAGRGKTKADPVETAKAVEKAAKGSLKGGTARPKEEGVATTRAELEQVYKDVKSGDPAKRAKALQKLGISK